MWYPDPQSMMTPPATPQAHLPPHDVARNSGPAVIFLANPSGQLRTPDVSRRDPQKSKPAFRHRAQIAQLVEQRIENPRVAGSIPALGTIKINRLADT